MARRFRYICVRGFESVTRDCGDIREALPLRFKKLCSDPHRKCKGARRCMSEKYAPVDTSSAVTSGEVDN